MFCFQTDYIDVNDIVETDVKYYVLADKINYFIPSLGSSIVSENPIVSIASSGTIETSQVIGKDFTRYLSQLLFNTPYGTDLFVNETELVDSTSHALYTAWSYCITGLENISNKSTNTTIPLEGNTNAKYLTNNYDDIQNICREMFLQLISKSPSRFVNLPERIVHDDFTQSIRENNNLKYYYLPFINNDVISIRIKVYPNINQPTFGLPTTNTEKFETINNDTHLKGRTYAVNLILTDYLTATTLLTGIFSIEVTGKYTTLETLNFLPIIQTDNILNVTTKNTQINANTIRCDIYYNIDTRNSTTYSILDVGVGFSAPAITYYNANIATINFLKFGGIPLYGKGSQFKNLLSNLIFSATDVPLLSPNTSLASAFDSMTNFNQDVTFLNNWNLSHVTTTESMFFGCIAFNQPISNTMTNLPNVTNMSNMFANCAIFNNGVIGNNGGNPLSFTTSPALTKMNGIFGGCREFNQTVSFTNMTNVTTISFMFANCRKFNNGDTENIGGKPLSFATSNNLTTTSQMFQNCFVFNQEVYFNKMVEIDGTFSSNVSRVTNMLFMFANCQKFNNGAIGNIGGKPLSFTTSTAFTTPINTNNMTTNSMFQGCEEFNQTVSISNMTNVTSLALMFSGCKIFNNGVTTNIGGKQLTFINTITSNLSTTLLMFLDCEAFNQTVVFPVMSGVFSMTSLFHGCKIFNNGDTGNNCGKPLSFVTSNNLVNVPSMFNNCQAFNQTVTISNVTGIRLMDNMFAGCKIFNNGVNTNSGGKSLTFTTSSSSLTTTSQMFLDCEAFNQTVYISNMPNVTTMAGMFRNCKIFNNGNTQLSFQTGIVLLNLQSMFAGCHVFNQTVTITNVTSVTNMITMFSGCLIFNNGFAPDNETNKLFPTRPTNITNAMITNFGSNSGLALTPSNRPSWMSSTWTVIT
jgi:hypothetical protein